MNEILKVLYSFAGDHQTERYLEQEQKELADNDKMCTAVIAELNAVLTPPWQQRLEDYIYGRDVMDSAHTEAYFCAGLAMGLYLGGQGNSLTV